MSLLEAPCAKTSWRALLFRAILGITGALIVCFDIWWFKQVNNSETGFSGHHCDFEQHVPCLAVHVCMNSVKFVLKAPGASILWGRYYSVIMCRLIWGALLLGGALLIGTLRYNQWCCRDSNTATHIINAFLAIHYPVGGHQKALGYLTGNHVESEQLLLIHIRFLPCRTRDSGVYYLFC